MKKFTLLFLLFLCSSSAFAQKTPPRAPKKFNPAARSPGSEKEELDKAVAQADKAERINALRKFTADFPKSKETTRVAELLVSTLAALADEKMQAGETADGIKLFKRAVTDAPAPLSDKLFTEVLLQIPNSLFLRGQTAAAIETARVVEAKTGGNAKQTLALAGFYLGLENAAEAKRLAEKSLALDPNLPAAYQTLGLAERINFNLENSVIAYQKALELAPDSAVSRRSLAEMKRAVGKPSEAVALYREVLAKDEADDAARTGLILALFDDEKRSEAEAEMQSSLAANPNNLPLLVGAAYWYAAHNNGARAVELAEKAVAVEPRYTWAHIALARGLVVQKRPLDAEKTLLTARQYGNFPTLEYELAAVRTQAGFYREAAEGLAKTFTIVNDAVATRLGGRVSKEAGGFIELLAAERQASIFEPAAADDPANAARMKSLLGFYQQVNTAPNDEAVSVKADEFIQGDDRMRLHRQLFAANLLLNRKSNLPKVLELSKAAVGGVDQGLSVENPAAAVLADELYESRQLAIARGEIIVVPEVARQTLSNILRGRIEDLAGWALFQQNKPGDAVLRLKRAVSILPVKSSWWRDSQWRLGTALEYNEKPKDALDAYVKSYTSGEPSAVRYGVIQSIYQKVNGSTDGLEARIGRKPDSVTAGMTDQNALMIPPAAPEIFKPASPTISETVPTTATAPPLTAAGSEIARVEPEKIEPAPTPASIIETAQKVEPTPISETEKAEPAPPETKPAAPKTIEPASRPIISDSAMTNGDRPPTAEPIQANQTTQTAPPTQKLLFEPIIITVPRAENKPPKTASEPETGSRPRVAVEKPAEPIAPCRILVNQETASIIGDGGSLALITELVGGGEVKEITATSSSPADVEAAFDSEIGGQMKRALFVVKSISQKKGVFIVTFATACGKKDVSVSVR